MPYHDTARDAAEMFDLVPVALWLEDYSGVKALFQQWRDAGVTDLRAYLRDNPGHLQSYVASIRLLRVNRKTLEQYEAENLEHLAGNLAEVLRDDMLKSLPDELAQLWEGGLSFESLSVNYTLSGRRLDIQLKGSILPGHEESWARVMVSTEDVTEREIARRLAAQSESYARGLFEHSPISLWVEDLSGIKTLLDDLRAQGIDDLRAFTAKNPEFVQRCIMEIRVLDVNRETLFLFKAEDKNTLLQNIHMVFRDEMVPYFREILIALWEEKQLQRYEIVNYALNGEKLYLLLQVSILPGYENDWAQVQIALTDITARKKTEAYLEYLGTHDALSKLHNRYFFVEALNRLTRDGTFPVTIIVIDLNGLKEINDRLGHEAGDEILRRAGAVLRQAVAPPYYATRIGGDEFAVMMPGADAAAGAALLATIQSLVEIDNQVHGGTLLDFAMGAATSQPGERLDAVTKRADLSMYDAKRRHYKNRRRTDRKG